MAGLTGIGCTLVPHPPSGALRVSSLDSEGPAAKGGYVGIGDVLFDQPSIASFIYLCLLFV